MGEGGEGDIEAVAIDGPAGAGKSSVARKVAGRRGYLYVDTGAMYRAAALAALRRGIDLEDGVAMLSLLEGVELSFNAAGDRLFLDREDVSAEIRGPEVTEKVKYAARIPGIRARLMKMQQAMSERRPVVMEGRDITTVVLPRARWKFFLTARPEVRARRRRSEMLAAGREVPEAEILADIVRRDASDYQVGPMRDARDLALAGAGIVYLDTSRMTPEQVVAAMLERMEGPSSQKPG
ncbi:MAG: (d)CMP kinase [Planctomycetota bacterium]|jgi:cytidylate kinase|nr:(d)CMP kinase [Planctomycetota bacterium]